MCRRISAVLNFLNVSIDERNNQTFYKRYSNTGLVYQIDYPDGGHKYFRYRGFAVNGYVFYKVDLITDQRGTQTFFGYDETDENHGGSGYAGLLTSVTRKYVNGYNNLGTNPGERIRLFYDNLDRVITSIDPRGVTESSAYNPRGQVTRVTHGADNTHVDL